MYLPFLCFFFLIRPLLNQFHCSVIHTYKKELFSAINILHIYVLVRTNVTDIFFFFLLALAARDALLLSGNINEKESDAGG